MYLFDLFFPFSQATKNVGLMLNLMLNLFRLGPLLRVFDIIEMGISACETEIFWRWKITMWAYLGWKCNCLRAHGKYQGQIWLDDFKRIWMWSTHINTELLAINPPIWSFGKWLQHMVRTVNNTFQPDNNSTKRGGQVYAHEVWANHVSCHLIYHGSKLGPLKKTTKLARSGHYQRWIIWV